MYRGAAGEGSGTEIEIIIHADTQLMQRFFQTSLSAFEDLTSGARDIFEVFNTYHIQDMPKEKKGGLVAVLKIIHGANWQNSPGIEVYIRREKEQGRLSFSFPDDSILYSPAKSSETQQLLVMLFLQLDGWTGIIADRDIVGAVRERHRQYYSMSFHPIHLSISEPSNPYSICGGHVLQFLLPQRPSCR
jgi:hypothetical protein